MWLGQCIRLVKHVILPDVLHFDYDTSWLFEFFWKDFQRVLTIFWDFCFIIHLSSKVAIMFDCLRRWSKRICIQRRNWPHIWPQELKLCLTSCLLLRVSNWLMLGQGCCNHEADLGYVLFSFLRHMDSALLWIWHGNFPMMHLNFCFLLSNHSTSYWNCRP